METAAGYTAGLERLGNRTFDLVLADGRLGSRENTLIDQLQRALRVDDLLARRIIEVCSSRTARAGRRMCSGRD